MSGSSNPKFLISACLVGCPCRYDGKSQSRAEMQALHLQGQAIAVCPEELAGLGTPRAPCEKVGRKILSIDGEDKTAQFQQGAEKALAAFPASVKIETAYLKSKSPMCGYGSIYDGSFSGKVTAGNGIFAELLEQKGISIKSID